MTANLLDLNKAFTLNLEKAGVSNTEIPQMEVRLAIDCSGSMHSLFSAGFVNDVVTQFVGVAMSFDDNASIETGFFNNSWISVEDATPDNVGNYMNQVGIRAGGGTEYSSIIQEFELGRPGRSGQQKSTGFLGKLFGRNKPTPDTTDNQNLAGSAIPGMRAYAAVITDGECFDRDRFENMLDQTSGEVFYQFIALGEGGHCNYLKRQADKYPHVSFFCLTDSELVGGHVDDDLLYGRICNDEFVAWLKK